MGFLDSIFGKKKEPEEKVAEQPEPEAEAQTTEEQPEPEAEATTEDQTEGPKSFADVVKMMGEMSPEEMKASVEDSMKVCAEYCGKCPSYEGTGETDLLFCAKGKSDVITDEKGCTCGGCPVQASMMLEWDYYCTKGSGRQQAGL